MTLAILAVTAGALLVLPGRTNNIGRRLPPREWSWLCGIGLGGGLALIEAATTLRAAPPLLTAVGVPGLAAACSRVMGPLLGGGPLVTWGAGAVAAALPVRAAMVWRRTARGRRRVAAELWLGERAVIAGYDVVVLPVGRPAAISFAASGEKFIVVSTGLLGVLDERQVEAVLAHEVAHLRHRHQRLLAIAAVAEGVAGWLRPAARSAAALRLAVERAADEDAAAAAGPGGRQAVRDSLVALANAAPAGDVAAFADAATVAARIHAMDAPPPPVTPVWHTLLYAPGAAAGLAVGAAMATWGGHLQTVVAMAGRCGV